MDTVSPIFIVCIMQFTNINFINNDIKNGSNAMDAWRTSYCHQNLRPKHKHFVRAGHSI